MFTASVSTRVTALHAPLGGSGADAATGVAPGSTGHVHVAGGSTADVEVVGPRQVTNLGGFGRLVAQTGGSLPTVDC